MEPAVYTGDTCRVELQMYQECFSGSSSGSDILIRSDIDQETVETTLPCNFLDSVLLVWFPECLHVIVNGLIAI